MSERAALLAAAVQRIERTSGSIRVTELARVLGVEASTLRRRFREDLGITAKRLCEVVRVRHAHAFLRTHPEATRADAIVRYGYSDQLHLVRTYARFASISPTRWRPEVRFIDLNFGIERPEGVSD